MWTYGDKSLREANEKGFLTQLKACQQQVAQRPHWVKDQGSEGPKGGQQNCISWEDMVQHFMEDIYASFLFNMREFIIQEDQCKDDQTLTDLDSLLKYMTDAMYHDELNMGTIAKRAHFASAANTSEWHKQQGNWDATWNLSKKQQNEDHFFVKKYIDEQTNQIKEMQVMWVNQMQMVAATADLT